MFEAGSLARSCSRWVDADIIDEWSGRLFDAMGTMVNERERLKERFAYYQQIRLPRKERKRIL